MKFIPMSYDLSAKFFFHTDEVIVTRFLEALLNIKVNNYVLLENKLLVSNAHKYHYTTNIVFKVNNKLIVSIEINIPYFNHVINKSLRSLAKFIIIKVSSEENFNDLKLNLNTSSYLNEKTKIIIRDISENDYDLFDENTKFIIRNIDKYLDMYYLGNRSDETAFTALFEAKSFEEIDEMLKGRVPDENRINFIKMYKSMCENKEIIKAYEKDMCEKRTRDRIMREVEETRFLEGIEKVVKQMLKEKISYETISKVSGFSTQKIKSLENQE